MPDRHSMGGYQNLSAAPPENTPAGLFAPEGDIIALIGS